MITLSDLRNQLDKLELLKETCREAQEALYIQEKKRDDLIWDIDQLLDSVKESL